ncbi:hypothetical protein GCM10027416_22330 [Okibacterium endophyticum]
MTITAAADGSALGNPGPAGWAWYVDDDNWDAGGWKHATNNQGELKAVLELFRATAHVDDDLLILCDSQYVINCITKWMPGWKRKGWRKGDGKPVMNVDMLTEIDEALVGRRYTFEWVRGHVGHVLNEAADARARAAAEAFQRAMPIPSGPGFEGVTSETARPGQTRGVRAQAPTQQTRPEPAPPAPRPEEPSLFLFDDGPLGFDDAHRHTVVVALTDDQHSRLQRRARQTGLAPDEFLRSLI